ncbi:hypothetical protein M0R45_000841 [Rubus argutus]|uniref:Uncharacterized protein n=1 Tax=Rubus argutus TaxID=59490 RepID=A0AAW1VPJ6_RUBAR
MKPCGIPPPEAAPPLCAHTRRAQLAPASSRSSPPLVLKQEERNEIWRGAGEMKREQDEEEKKEDRTRGEKKTDGKGNRERKGDGKTNQKEGKRRKREKHGKRDGACPTRPQEHKILGAQKNFRARYSSKCVCIRMVVFFCVCQWGLSLLSRVSRACSIIQ